MYDDPVKDVAWRSYWQGYKQGRDVEQVPPIAKKTAKNRFERFWKRNA